MWCNRTLLPSGGKKTVRIQFAAAYIIAAVLFIPTLSICSDHPFLVTSRSEFPYLKGIMSEEPWQSRAASAKSHVKANKPTFDVPDDYDEKKNRAKSLSKYINSLALAYILELDVRDQAAIDAGVDIDEYIVQRIYESITADRGSLALLSCDWNEYMPPIADAFFFGILALDIAYDDLTTAQINDSIAVIGQCVDDIVSTNAGRLGGASPDYNNTSWYHAYRAITATWERFLGNMTGPDDAYFNWIMHTTSAEGPCYFGGAYSWARNQGSDRTLKTAYMDLLEYVGDNRYYDNPVLQHMNEWLFSHDITPFKKHPIFGDTKLKNSPSSSMLVYRTGQFGDTAAQLASLWAGRVGLSTGNLVTYVFPDDPLPADPVIGPTSDVYRDGGGWFQEPGMGNNRLAGVLYNPLISPKDGTAGHEHYEVNALYLAGFGNHLLIDRGYGSRGERNDVELHNVMGVVRNDNTVAEDHVSEVGEGIVEGFVTDDFDYATGRDGDALPDDEHNRNFFFVHPKEGEPGYWFVVDDLTIGADSDSTEVINFWRPNTEDVYADTTNELYTADITSDVGFNIYFGVAPDSVSIKNHSNDEYTINYLETNPDA